nr:uncharacterized protein LOC128690783 [Cherax quadricarinatus]
MCNFEVDTRRSAEHNFKLGKELVGGWVTERQFGILLCRKLSEIHEEGCLKNELRTNITESVQHEEDKPTPVKTDTSTAVDESISQMKGSQESRHLEGLPGCCEGRGDQVGDCSTCDDLTCYRKLRTRDLKDENQAVRSSEDESNYKILLDVYDFLGGEVTAKVVEGKELVVEGRAQRQSGTSLTILSFLRRFPLPDRADLTAIMAVMSSDGVLLIIVPKLKKYSKDKALNKEACIERHSRMDVDVGRGLREKNVRESSRESEGRSLGSFLSTGLRHSPELSSFRKEMSTDSQHSRMDNFSDTGHSWDDRKMQDSSRASSSASSSTYQHSTDLF